MKFFIRSVVALLLCIGVNVLAYAVQHFWPRAGVAAGWCAASIYLFLVRNL